MNPRFGWALLVVCAVLAPLGSCLDRPLPVDFVLQDSLSTAPVVSDPQTSVMAGGAVVLASLQRSENGEVVFVSLPPGTIPAGGFASIRNGRTGVEAEAAMAEGGFDPVQLSAAAGDTVAITARLEGGATQVLTLVVPARRRPVVVRADPPPRKRDVPLNTAVVVVFSEPIQATSGSTIRVLENGSPVSGTTVITTDGLRAEFRSTQPLSPNTEFVLSIGSDVTDQSGDQMGTTVTTSFETGTTIIAASVATDPVALFTNPYSQAVRTFEMRAIRDDAGQVTGTFGIFYPQTGMRLSGRVTCFAIVGGDSAWIGGVLEAAPAAIGSDAVWRAVDIGTPSPTAHDKLSLLLSGLDAGQAQDWCANTPAVFPDSQEALLFDIETGNIVVSATGAPPPPPPPPPPPLPPDPSRLSQVASFTPYMAILAMNIDGTELRTVTTGPRDQNPSWSPDARKLAFHSDRTQQDDWDIYLVNWDGSGLQHLTSGSDRDVDPVWSPDGLRIAFSRNSSIHVMSANGSNVTRLSFACCDYHPSWSPDGSRIVFASGRGGVNAIYVMNADGSGEVQLTNEGARDFSPTWSPDGTKIAFARRTDGGDEGLYVMNTDGSGLTQLTLGVNGGGSWSPDGSRLVYELFGMNLINADGTGIKRIGFGFNPAWSPIGIVPTAPVPFRSIEKVSGDAQNGVVGDTLAELLRVRVIDDGGAPQPGVTVRWNVWQGTGARVGVQIQSQQPVTDSVGYAALQVKLGTTAGSIRIRAAVVDGTARRGEVVFTATAVSGP